MRLPSKHEPLDDIVQGFCITWVHGRAIVIATTHPPRDYW